jgi:hypothetical protein
MLRRSTDVWKGTAETEAFCSAKLLFVVCAREKEISMRGTSLLLSCVQVNEQSETTTELVSTRDAPLEAMVFEEHEYVIESS